MIVLQSRISKKVIKFVAVLYMFPLKLTFGSSGNRLKQKDKQRTQKNFRKFQKLIRFTRILQPWVAIKLNIVRQANLQRRLWEQIGCLDEVETWSTAWKSTCNKHLSTCWAVWSLCSEFQVSSFCELSPMLGWAFGG